MTLRKSLTSILFIGLLICGAGSMQKALAQATTEPAQTEKRGDEINLDTQLYLLLASNQDVGDTKLPPALEPVMKQLRTSLPFKNYRLAATLINRVSNGGNLSLKWVGGPLLAGGVVSASTPTFNEFRVARVKLTVDTEGQQVVRMDGFSFGARVPIQTSSTVASNAPAAPVFNYEPTGLNTDISMREGEPVVVGTLNLGPSGDAIILVMSAKRAMR